MGSEPYPLDEEYNNKVGLNRSMGSQPYSLNDEHNNTVGLPRSMGSQPYSLDDEHNTMVMIEIPLTCLAYHSVVLVIKWVELGSH
jgi:hypothetical protein